MASGSSDFVKDLARRPPRQKVAILLGVLGLLGFLYWQFFYSGLTEELDGAVAEKASLVQKFEELQRKQKQMRAYAEEYEQLQATIRANARGAADGGGIAGLL